MPLTTVEQSLLLAAYFRGMPPDPEVWVSSCDQVVTLSLLYTGDISHEDCQSRFSRRSYVASLYDDDAELRDEIGTRYRELIGLLKDHPDLIEGAGNLEMPADPTFTSCGLTRAGFALIPEIIGSFPAKPDFPNWPDERRWPNS